MSCSLPEPTAPIHPPLLDATCRAAALGRLVLCVAAVSAVMTSSFESAARAEPIDDAIASVLPTVDEERFLSVPWRTNLMAAREEAQAAGKPIFLWMMTGHPQGTT